MSNRTCLYDVLNSNGKIEVTKESSLGDIKKAFKRLAMKYHPDRLQGKSDAEKQDAEKHFDEMKYAYTILSDEKTRGMYDAGGFAALDDAAQNGGESSFDFSDMDIDDVLKDIDEVDVREDTIAVKRKNARPSAMDKFSKRNKSEKTAGDDQQPEAKAESTEKPKPAGKVVMDAALRDEFAAFARTKGNADLAAKIEALEVVYSKPGDKGPSR